MMHFDELLQKLFQKIVLMGLTAETMIDLAVRSVIERNAALAKGVFSKEQEVNALQVQIDAEAVRLTATHQPVAKDVRFLFMATRICSELERIGDQAVNISQNGQFVMRTPPMKLVELPIMAEIAKKMVRDSLTAMIDHDVVLANRVLEEEEKVDAFRDRVFHAMLGDMGSESDIKQRSISLILIARNLERIGDHATNMAEEVIYWIQGRDVRHGNAADLDSESSQIHESEAAQ